MKKKRVLISGAGIAGPVLAHWLTRYGIKSTIIERAPIIRTAGQTIDIADVGRDVVRKMGIEKDLLERRTFEEGTKLVNSKDKVLSQFSVEGGFSFTNDWEIVRGELANLLYEKTKNDTDYIFDDYITAIEEQGTHAQVSFAKNPKQDFDIVVGADGQTSKTRRIVFGDNVIPSPTVPLDLYVAWLSVPWVKNDGSWSRIYAPGGSRGIWLRPDGQKTTSRAFFMWESKPNGLENLPVAQQKEEVSKLWQNTGWEVPRLLSGMNTASDFYLQSVVQIKMDTWHKGRYVGVGDAAYCPSPCSGNGTTAAVFGAYVLAGEIAKHINDHNTAFSEYERIMRPYIQEVQDVPRRLIGLCLPETQLGVKTLAAFFKLASLIIRSGLAKQIIKVFPLENKPYPVPNYEQYLV